MAEESNDADPKIIDLILAHSDKEPWRALEFFPPRTPQGVENLKARMPRMKAEAKPLYTDITWGAGGTTSDATMDIAISMRKEHGIVTNMHLTCTNIEAEKVTAALEQAKAAGIRNIVALRGDAPEGQATWETTAGGFACAADLVSYIRKQFGDAFCISVAGYPEGHPEKIKEVAGGIAALSVSEQTRYSAQTNEDGSETVFVCSDADYAQELLFLKAKVDAGADFIITQMFFDVEVYGGFVAACRGVGITVPIVPGIMCLNSAGGFVKMAAFCKTRVPSALRSGMDAVKDSAEDTKAYGIAFGTQMSKRLLELLSNIRKLVHS